MSLTDQANVYYQLIQQGVPAAQAYAQAFPEGLPTAEDRAKAQAKDAQKAQLGQLVGTLGGAGLTYELASGGALSSKLGGLFGAGAGSTAGTTAGASSAGLAAPQIVGAKVVGSGAGATGAGTAGASGTGALSSALGTVAPLAAVGHGLYTGGKFLSGDKLNTGEKLAYALPTAGLSLFSDELQGLFGSGKSKEQKGREATRESLAEMGLARNDDGQGIYLNFEGQDPYLMGFSGDFMKGQDRSILDPTRVLERDKAGMTGNRQSWDVDYTSDLDFMSNLASSGLGTLLSGQEMSPQQRQVFNEISNASIADTDRQFNEANWANTIGDIRGLYEKAGITNADIANQRIADLAGSGMSQFDLDQLRQASGLVFGDNSFQLASDLNAGRWGGIDMPNQSVDPMTQTRPYQDDELQQLLALNTQKSPLLTAMGG